MPFQDQTYILCFIHCSPPLSKCTECFSNPAHTAEGETHWQFVTQEAKEGRRHGVRDCQTKEHQAHITSWEFELWKGRQIKQNPRQTIYATFIEGQSENYTLSRNTEMRNFKYFTDTIQRFFKYLKSSTELQFYCFHQHFLSMEWWKHLTQPYSYKT